MRQGRCHTLIPEGLAEDLVSSSHVPVEVLGFLFLANFCVMVLCVTAELIKRSSVKALLDGRKINRVKVFRGGHPAWRMGVTLICRIAGSGRSTFRIGGRRRTASR